MLNSSFRNERLHDKKPRSDGDDRTPAQRDRDRILYSSSFRRLAEVTQVVSANSGYVFHNRLTHSLQVARVGRRLAEKLAKRHPTLAAGIICPDVVEAACLAHDLGHPPFGHTAESRLNILAAHHGGFEGNAQSFRIVTQLASRSDTYGGLDLTAATLAAILKYPWLKGDNPAKPRKWGAYESERDSFEFAIRLLPDKNERTIEAELMDWRTMLPTLFTIWRTSIEQVDFRCICWHNATLLSARNFSRTFLNVGATIQSSRLRVTSKKRLPAFSCRRSLFRELTMGLLSIERHYADSLQFSSVDISTLPT